MMQVDRPDDLPGGREVALAARAHPTSIDGAVAWEGPDGANVRLFGPGCLWRDAAAALQGLDHPVAVWIRGGRTQAALRLLRDDPSMTPHAAARAAGVNVAAVYRARARADRPRCSHCGQHLPAAN